MVKPHSVADDLGGKPVAVIRVGWQLHQVSLADLQP
jgi:hypothetical protein